MAASSATNRYEGEKMTVMRNYPYTVHPYAFGMSTSSAKFTTLSLQSTAATSGSSSYKTHFATTISWPGFSTAYPLPIDEAEFSMIFRANTTSTKAGSSIGYRWEWKNKGESTWQALSTWRKCKSSASGGATRTITGYATLGAGYNKVPFNLRLRTYNKVAAKITMKLKNTSYVIIKGKRST